MGNFFSDTDVSEPRTLRPLRTPSLGVFPIFVDDSHFTQDYLKEIQRRNKKMIREAIRSLETSQVALYRERLNKTR